MTSPNQPHCDLCREETPILRPLCIKNRTEIPKLCSDCTLAMDAAGRVDRDRDAKEFRYAG